jgi:hypothetical protein
MCVDENWGRKGQAILKIIIALFILPTPSSVSKMNNTVIPEKPKIVKIWSYLKFFTYQLYFAISANPHTFAIQFTLLPRSLFSINPLSLM